MIRALLLLIAGFTPMGFAASYTTAGGGGAAGALMGGTTAIGIYGGVVNASQDALNSMQQSANLRQGGISTGQLNQAYEIAPALTYRFSGSIYALQIRPSYFYERADGQSNIGQFTYGVTGWTVFPMLRMYPLENQFMKFYMQVGIGYGEASGMISEGVSGGTNNHVTFGSGAFGTMVGMGADFCLTANSCIAFEGNYRYLQFIRNIVSNSSGSFNTSGGSLSQWGKGQELELNNNDVAINMGGLMFMAGYTYWF
jgi:hypothetical protein